jgi:hypothetical protein
MLEESLFRGGGVTERGALRLSSLLAGFGGINVSLALVITSFVDVGFFFFLPLKKTRKL